MHIRNRNRFTNIENRSVLPKGKRWRGVGREWKRGRGGNDWQFGIKQIQISVNRMDKQDVTV